MRHAVLACLLATAAAAVAPPAFAADRPVIAPAPAWVRPVAVPAAPPAPDDAPVRILLADQQVAFEPAGRTSYSATTMLIQTPQGLSAGNISLPWRPETDTLTVHALRIHRGTQVIDVLASAQTFTVVRRETNLESAMLDGVLTANIQPEGLQVGDRLEIATSVTSRDPTLRGHAEQLGGGWNGVPFGRAHLSMEWPAAMPVRLRATGTLPTPKPVRTGALVRFDLQLDDVKPLVLPRGAPARFQLGRLVEATDYAGWADLAALMAPLYRTAATLPATGPLQAEVARIAALSPDPRVRTEAALALVQDRVRYVALAMGAGGLVPAAAAETWARRYGDCKGKTALLLALLAALGVPAEPVAVSTVFGDGMDARLPMIALFDHVLVRATVAGRPYWLDGTRTGDTSLDRLNVPGFGWGLPLVASGAALVRIVPPPLALPVDDVSIRIDATAGLAVPAPVRIEQVFRGDLAQSARLGLANLSGDARDRALRDYWKARYDFIDATAATAAFDPKTGEQRLVLEGRARMKWGSYGYETDGTLIGYKADFARDPGPDRDAPFAVAYPWYGRVKETVLLPPGFETLKAGGRGDVDRTIAGVAYRRTSTLADNVFTIEKTERSIAPEFPAAEAPAAQAALRTLAEDAIYIRKPANYREGKAEIDARLAVPSTDADELYARGGVLSDAGRIAEAVAQYTAALGVDARHVRALAGRARARTRLGDLAGAGSDIAAAAAIDPKFAQMHVARGMLADAEGRPQGAVAAYTAALAVDPTYEFARHRRAFAHAAAGEEDLALADAAAVLERDPDALDLNLLRASIYRHKGDPARGTSEIRHMLATRPNDPDALALAAGYYAEMPGGGDDAREALDRALALRPDANGYTRRSTARPKTDLAGRAADLDKALQLDPDSLYARRLHAELATEREDHATAIADWTKLIALRPGDAAPLDGRARAYKAAKNLARARTDADAAIRLSPRNVDLYLLRANLNNLSDRKTASLAQADAVVAANADDPYAHVVAAAIYSNAGRDDAANAAYARALAIKPAPFVYYERYLHRKPADLAGRRADLDATLALDPNYGQAVAAKAWMLAVAGDFAAAIPFHTRLLTIDPTNIDARANRGVAYARAGDQTRADADFAEAGRMAKTATERNTLCWAKATGNVALASALADCDAALKQTPDDADIINSRALVLLRLGRFDDAIAAYTRALTFSPGSGKLLFGRAVAYARKGDAARSAADAAAARKANPTIPDDYAAFGVRL